MDRELAGTHCRLRGKSYLRGNIYLKGPLPKCKTAKLSNPLLRNAGAVHFHCCFGCSHTGTGSIRDNNRLLRSTTMYTVECDPEVSLPALLLHFE